LNPFPVALFPLDLKAMNPKKHAKVDDAVKLRRGIGNCFERANTPSLSDAQRTQALTFVVVGAVSLKTSLMGLEVWDEGLGVRFKVKELDIRGVSD